jgi:hypothetical protein
VRRAVVLLVVLIATSTSLPAQTPLVSVGAGASSCGQWLEIQATARTAETALKRAMMLSWVQGYLVGAADAFTVLMAGESTTLAQSQTRFGTISGNVFDSPDADAVSYWVSQFCGDKPLARLTDASAALAAELFLKK